MTSKITTVFWGVMPFGLVDKERNNVLQEPLAFCLPNYKAPYARSNLSFMYVGIVNLKRTHEHSQHFLSMQYLFYTNTTV
jgi:hypothetical protein